MLDHSGGAAGAVSAGLLLLPFAGLVQTALLTYVAVGAAGILVLVASRWEPRAAAWRWERPAGYGLVGAALLALWASHLFATGLTVREDERLAAAVRRWAPEGQVEQQTGSCADGTSVVYFTVRPTESEEPGYAFSSRWLAGNVPGYGGPLELAILVGPDGALREVQVVDSNETPAYLQRVAGWMEALKGRHVLEEGALADVDVVSGATLTCEAVREALAAAGPRFAREVLGRGGPAVRAETGGRGWGANRDFFWLAAFTAGAIFLHRRPGTWTRRGFLLAVLVVLGFGLNAQFSSQHVLAVLGGRFPALRLDGPFFLMAVVPVVVLLCGNLYCGYLCPFGAVQELVGDLGSGTVEAEPGAAAWRAGRSVKYGVLFVLVLLYAISRDFSVVSGDPLVTIFGVARSRGVVVAGVALLILACFFRRFWCRTLCPAGAFLALLNGAHLLRRWMPAPRPTRCDVGVESAADLDCIRCDRCCLEGAAARLGPGTAGPLGEPRESWGFFGAAVVVGLAVVLFAALAHVPGLKHPAATLAQPAVPAAGPAAGEPRTVDLDLIQRLIDEGMLSNHPAAYYSTDPPGEEPGDENAVEEEPGGEGATVEAPSAEDPTSPAPAEPQPEDSVSPAPVSGGG